MRLTDTELAEQLRDVALRSISLDGPFQVPFGLSPPPPARPWKAAHSRRYRRRHA